MERVSPLTVACKVPGGSLASVGDALDEGASGFRLPVLVVLLMIEGVVIISLGTAAGSCRCIRGRAGCSAEHAPIVCLGLRRARLLRRSVADGT